MDQNRALGSADRVAGPTASALLYTRGSGTGSHYRRASPRCPSAIVEYRDHRHPQIRAPAQQAPMSMMALDPLRAFNRSPSAAVEFFRASSARVAVGGGQAQNACYSATCFGSAPRTAIASSSDAKLGRTVWSISFGQNAPMHRTHDPLARARRASWIHHRVGLDATKWPSRQWCSGSTISAAKAFLPRTLIRVPVHTLPKRLEIVGLCSATKAGCATYRRARSPCGGLYVHLFPRLYSPQQQLDRIARIWTRLTPQSGHAAVGQLSTSFEVLVEFRRTDFVSSYRFHF